MNTDEGKGKCKQLSNEFRRETEKAKRNKIVREEKLLNLM